MRRKLILSLISFVAAITAAVSLYMVASTLLIGAKEQSTFDELVALVEQAKGVQETDQQMMEESTGEAVDESEAETYSEIDPETGMLKEYEVIYDQNHDFFGWLQIEDTPINYPVMYTPEDPQYYLHRSFKKKKAESGTPFMDAACCEGCGNYIIYGHHMNNGTMFHDLVKYADRKYWEKHKTIRFDTLYERGEYEVIAAFYGQAIAKGTPGFRYYQYSDLTDPELFEEYMTQVYQAAEYSTGVTAEYGDELITLSTCSYHTSDGRFAVVARKKK